MSYFKNVNGELHTKYKLLSYERDFKTLKNNMCTTAIGKANLELWRFKGEQEKILKPVRKCCFLTFDLHNNAKNDVTVDY